MDRWRSVTLVAALAALPLGSCGGNAEHGTSREDLQLDTRPAWTVRFGSRGGFTGGGDGNLVHSDGRVQAWSQITPDDSISLRDVGHASPDALRELHEAMIDPEFVALTHRETGNLTTFLEWIEGTEIRHYSWAERHGAPELPRPLERALEGARAAVASARE